MWKIAGRVRVRGEVGHCRPEDVRRCGCLTNAVPHPGFKRLSEERTKSASGRKQPQLGTRLLDWIFYGPRCDNSPFVRRHWPELRGQSRGASLQSAGIFRSEEHTSELQSLMRISYAVFCLNKKKETNINHPTTN